MSNPLLYATLWDILLNENTTTPKIAYWCGEVSPHGDREGGGGVEQVHTAPGVGRGLRRARTSPPPRSPRPGWSPGAARRGVGGGSRLTQEGGPGSQESVGFSDDPLVGMVRGSVAREACWRGGSGSDQRGRGLGVGGICWGGVMEGKEGGKRPRAATQKHRTRGHTHPWAIGLPASLVSHPQQESGIQHTIPNTPPQ